MEKTFEIRISGSVQLSVGAIWPEGDAPDAPSANDVLEALVAYGLLSEVVRDWGIEQAFAFDVAEVKQAP